MDEITPEKLGQAPNFGAPDALDEAAGLLAGEPAGAPGQRGLFHKFRVTRVDGRDAPRDRAARYFVGNYVGDPHARVMVQAYADACRADDPQLADDLEAELADSAADHERWGVGHVCSASPPPVTSPPRWAVPTGWTAPLPFGSRTDYDRPTREG